MPKYTPGPWVKKGLDWYGSNGERVLMSDGPSFGSKTHFKDAEANARLIAAAPELLEALEGVLKAWDEPNCGDFDYTISLIFDPMKKAREALNKATDNT